MSETRHQFCRRHSSWFCPCVSPWLYGAAAKAAYLNNESGARGLANEIFRVEALNAEDEEQVDLIEETLR
jgi:hypothetical protein